MKVLKQWRELEPGVWGASTPDGLDFVIEDISGPGAPPRFRASQYLRTCCSGYERPVGTFPSRQEAMEFLDGLAAEQSTVPDDD